MLLSLCMYISLIFNKVAERRIYGVVKYVIIALLQIVSRVWQWKNFKNRSIIDEDMDKSQVPRFLVHPVYILWTNFFFFSFFFSYYYHQPLLQTCCRRTTRWSLAWTNPSQTKVISCLVIMSEVVSARKRSSSWMNCAELTTSWLYDKSVVCDVLVPTPTPAAVAVTNCVVESVHNNKDAANVRKKTLAPWMIPPYRFHNTVYQSVKFKITWHQNWAEYQKSGSEQILILSSTFRIASHLPAPIVSGGRVCK